ncbi:MAG: glutamate--tRNA ligase [Rhodobacteraceae bacterium]|nr:glutamate--tRNA ligase [Paracoccaceae bacterium]
MITTRFAPSPTGRLHIGNLRAAMLSWLTARKGGGCFILRIDDTDAERSKEEYVDAAKADLTWLGLEWDRYERQSERMARYEAVAQQWREMGRLYACYETPTELELRRKRQLSMGKPPVYDRSALNLTKDQIAAYQAEGRRPHWRFKLDQERVEWEDQIRGHVSVDCASVSDPVLIRDDGGFLYTPCSVVDDIDMEVSHIVRGEDHVTNTATQIQMIRSLGAEPPTFAHHSLLVGATGEALSKRLGSLSLASFRERGVEPMALLSLMARLGTSDPIEPRRERQALAEGFDISRFGRAPARFDEAEIDRLNASILHETPYEEVANRLQAAGVHDEIAEQLWLAVRGNLGQFADIETWAKIVAEGATPDIAPEDAEFIPQALALLPEQPWGETAWKDWTDKVKAETGRKGKALFMPLRKALTGQERGPEMAALMPLLRPPKG